MSWIEGWNNTSDTPTSCKVGLVEPSKLSKLIESGIWEAEYNDVLWTTRSNCDWLKREVLEKIWSDARLQYLRHYRDLSSKQKQKVNQLISSVNGDFSELSNKDIFDHFSKDDKTLRNDIRVKKIGDIRIIQSDDIAQLSINDLHKISSRNWENNAGVFLVLWKDGFTPQSPDAIKKALLSYDQNITNELGERILNMAIWKVIPWFSTVISAMKTVDSKLVSMRANQFNAILERG